MFRGSQLGLGPFGCKRWQDLSAIPVLLPLRAVIRSGRALSWIGRAAE
ncbi:hypothetical protein NSU_0381 [Novosphingobium pentaromativorans US6-1]|uniref:Uncharacterized protein n=1 Tax=Novosphingobium pentaromativorans US6-1 TaxID=1088721 RepID=G6E7R0_9SPHN|nr:hypothetical protein NSU_0381 [Novosphingobium pentaromativorans US6-1]